MMSEVRIDPLSGLRTIVAPERAARNEDEGDPFAARPQPEFPGRRIGLHWYGD